MRTSQATKGAVREPKGLVLVVLLATLQGLASLGVFARIVMWGDKGAANGLPDTSLTSIFANTDLFKTSLGQITIGDVSLWAERAILLGICLLVAWLAWRMRSQK
jgi:hypothetical protein